MTIRFIAHIRTAQEWLTFSFSFNNQNQISSSITKKNCIDYTLQAAFRCNTFWDSWTYVRYVVAEFYFKLLSKVSVLDFQRACGREKSCILLSWWVLVVARTKRYTPDQESLGAFQ